MAAPAPQGFSYGAIILALVSLIGTGYVEYTHTDRETVQRVSALETHKTDTDRRLDRIEEKIDKLIEWAIGEKPKR